MSFINPYSIAVSLNGRNPERVARLIFAASDVFEWPDEPGARWFVRLIRDRQWHLVSYNELTDRLAINMRWDIDCLTGYEAWVLWNIRVYGQLAELCLPQYREQYIVQLVEFRHRLSKLGQQPQSIHGGIYGWTAWQAGRRGCGQNRGTGFSEQQKRP